MRNLAVLNTSLGSVTQQQHRLRPNVWGSAQSRKNSKNLQASARSASSILGASRLNAANTRHGRNPATEGSTNAGSNNQARNAVAQSYGGYIRRPLADRGALLRVGLPICSRVGGTREGACIRTRSIAYRRNEAGYLGGRRAG